MTRYLMSPKTLIYLRVGSMLTYLPPDSLLQMPSAGAHRLSSVSSHDSGFVSQDANTHSKPPSPMPSDITSQVKVPTKL